MEEVKKVLINGETIVSVIKSSGLLRQELDRAIRRITTIDQKLAPDGWREVTVTVPEKQALEIEEIEKTAILNSSNEL